LTDLKFFIVFFFFFQAEDGIRDRDVTGVQTCALPTLALGYTKPIGEIYKTAGIEFDFSEVYVKNLADFLENKIKEFN